MSYDIGMQFQRSQRQYSKFLSLSSTSRTTTASKHLAGFNVLTPPAMLQGREMLMQPLHGTGASAQIFYKKW